MILQQQQHHQITKEEIESGLNVILSHLEEPLYPRKISAQKSQNKQFKAESKQDIINSFKDSDFIDCRINAFPILKDCATWIPELFFIDLDLLDFKSKRSLQIALNKTLKNIKDKLDKNAHPTILWSGNGYHIILPVFCPRELERIQEFQEFDNPSERFLRFAKDYLSNCKADKSNYPSFRSCLLRIPNSLNGKCLARGESLENSMVKIIQEWNGYRPPIKELLYDFRRYLIQNKIDEYNYKQKLLLANKKRSINTINIHGDLKLQNILINTDTNEITLIDFGGMIFNDEEQCELRPALGKKGDFIFVSIHYTRS